MFGSGFGTGGELTVFPRRWTPWAPWVAPSVCTAVVAGTASPRTLGSRIATTTRRRARTTSLAFVSPGLRLKPRSPVGEHSPDFGGVFLPVLPSRCCTVV